MIHILLFWRKKNWFVTNHSIYTCIKWKKWIIPIKRNTLIKSFVIIFCNIFFIFFPKRFCFIYLFKIHFFWFFLLFFFSSWIISLHHNWSRNIITILFYQIFKLPLFNQIFICFIYKKCDFCSSFCPFRIFQIKSSFSVRNPLMSCFIKSWLTFYFNFISNHKRWIKSNSELSNQIVIFIFFCLF